MSKHIFRISGIDGLSLEPTVHLLALYQGFILMSVHAGNHIGAHTAKKKAVSVAFRIVAVVVSIYGAYAFVKRDVSSYLFIKNQFVFFDFEQPRLWFFVDFALMICLFACVGAGIFHLIISKTFTIDDFNSYLYAIYKYPLENSALFLYNIVRKKGFSEQNV